VIHFDTSFLIRSLIEGTPEMKAVRSLLAARAAVGMDAVAWTEFLCGPLGDPHLELAHKIVGRPDPFTGETALLAARLFNATGRRRGTLVDCMVAASAIKAGAQLATSNGRDFERFVPHGLDLFEEDDLR
jgi:predicted nucleic acid-binding protein